MHISSHCFYWFFQRLIFSPFCRLFMNTSHRTFFCRQIVNQILLIGLLFVSAHLHAQKIYVYCGPGVAADSLYQLRDMLRDLVPNYSLECVDSKTIFSKDWEKDASLLIVPGGADRPYAHILNGEGNRRIRAFVEGGGSYLGICAGSYYAGERIEFARGEPIEVIGDRELAFFPGLVRGPILAPFVYGSHAGVRAAELEWAVGSSDLTQRVSILYNGGGYFVDAELAPNTQVLLCYVDQSYNEDCCQSVKGEAAIIQCEVGKGIAILSAVHPEFNPYQLSAEDPFLSPLLSCLCASNHGRIELLKQLLRRLRIEVEK
ncbi:MAG TPA: biofilm PGA synthesis protein PgaB [Opitutae bacterium]|nr:biofilm PGA synthesis protein PgaB [Opitutae bacterium]